jgi:hypothetical protein
MRYPMHYVSGTIELFSLQDSPSRTADFAALQLGLAVRIVDILAVHLLLGFEIVTSHTRERQSCVLLCSPPDHDNFPGVFGISIFPFDRRVLVDVRDTPSRISKYPVIRSRG